MRRPAFSGVADGTRTRDSQDHNLVLYQLNYSHHRREPMGTAASSILAARALSSRIDFGQPSTSGGPSSAAIAAISLVDGPGGGTNAVRR